MRLRVPAFLVAALIAAPALAQTADTAGLMDRLDRLERDLNTLQAQVYRGQAPAQPAVQPANNGAMTNDAYSLLDQRISALEGQIRDLTGQLEKANFTAAQLSEKIGRMQSDDDFRFKEIEGKLSGAPAGVPGKTADAGAAGKTADAAAGTAPAQGMTPQEEYDHAFAQLRQADYDGATKAFQAFLAGHPNDPLAGNAMYWLGRIPYSQGDFKKAAPIFLDSYRKYPKSAKAGESLLMVGMAMSNLGEKKEACAALHRFSQEFPDAGDDLKGRAVAEKKKLGC